MLSYRHGYHAGNPADVFKHQILLALVRAMQDKPNGIQFVDTHAGPGCYDLGAARRSEHVVGIQALWDHGASTPLEQDYLDVIAAFNPGIEPGQRLRTYPGSPSLLRHLLRRQDKLVLCELHPAEQAALTDRFTQDKRIELRLQDGYQALSKVLPPQGGRGLVLIDPSWERADEMQHLIKALKVALKRFAHGVMVIWYPIIEGKDSLPERIPEVLGLSDEQWLDARRHFPAEQQLGRMTGCGMAIINCPWRARAVLAEHAGLV
jgi:23S rRNA (adenine2030-N6)-methyltransferase